MGAESACKATYDGRTVLGKARLETSVLEFRGADVKLSIPFSEMTKVIARGSSLVVSSPDGTVSFDLGGAAEKWARRILNPPSLLAKLGVKAEWNASAIGVIDDTFLEELRQRVAALSIGRTLSACDAIFFGATRAAQLHRLATLKKSLKPTGAIWVVRPKGRPEISERAVMAAGKNAGLVDVKVVAFSPTHTAEKFVIPLNARGR